MLIFLQAFDPLDFFGGIQDFFSGLSNFLNSLFRSLFNVLRAVSIFLWSAIVGVAKVLVATIRVLVRGFAHMINDIIHGRFADLLEDYRELKKNLHDILDPVIKVLKRYRDLYRRSVLASLRRFLNLIHGVRRILVIFRIFHLKFAERLDRWLVKQESRVIQRDLRLLQGLNTAITWLQLLTDPGQFIRQVPMLRSIVQSIAALSRAILAIPGLTNPFAQADTTAVAPTSERWSVFRSELREDRASGGGDLGEFRAGYKDILAGIRDELGTGA